MHDNFVSTGFLNGIGPPIWIVIPVNTELRVATETNSNADAQPTRTM
ncbi:hypothetical protein [Pseudophaeobacter sp. EL27]|nr:hypothetical protein [Pseudophaeobacter sp. EL27]